MTNLFSSRKKDNLEILQELVRVVTPQKLQKVRPIIAYEKHSKIRKLYDGLHLKKWKSERDAIYSIYGKEGSVSTFAKLKSDLGEKLISDILLINVRESDIPEAKKALWDCLLKYHTAIFLYKFTPYHKTPDAILEKIFPKCLKFEFTDLIIGISGILAWKYKIQNDLKKGNYYEQLLFNYLKIQLSECTGKIYLGNIYAQYATNKSYKPGISQQATQYLDQLNDIGIPFETQKTTYNKKMLEVVFHMSQFNYTATAAICEETIAYFENQDFIMPSTIRTFYFQAIASYTYLRKPENGYRLLKNCQQLLANTGSVNWFKLQELAIVMAIYAEDYQMAFKIFKETTHQERFGKLPVHLLEYWKLIEAMLYVIQSCGLLNSSGEQQLQLRFSSFVNSVPGLIRDKKGINFAIHLLQFFYLIQKGNAKAFQTYEDRLEQLGIYINRYCNDETMQRSRWMFQLLCLIAECNFDQKSILKNPKTKELLDNLQHTPYDITDANLDIEIIPYDHLFKLICSKLN